MGSWILLLLLPLITHCRRIEEEGTKDKGIVVDGGSLSQGDSSSLLRGGFSLGAEEDAIFETFKHDLIRYHGVEPSFADQFKINLRKAVELELDEIRGRGKGDGVRQGVKGRRQGLVPRQDYDEDDEDATTTTTQGPSPINIVNGIYGILTGLGSLNPDRVLASTANFFPPSQTQTANALIQSALGKNPGTWPTTTPTTTKLTTSTKDPDEDYDEDEDATTAKAVVAAVGGVTAAPGPVPGVLGVPATPVQVTAAAAQVAPVATAAPATG